MQYRDEGAGPPPLAPVRVLTRATLLQGVEHLVARDRRLAGIVERFGPPPLFARPRGFPTLAWIILEQQVSLGFTRQKARYVSGLAQRIVDGTLSLPRIARLDDRDAERALREGPGIGPWTAGVYLLMALRRPDVWPPGDLGLHKSLAEVRCMRAMPSSDTAATYALRWRPWRAVAARLLWHSYLSLRRKPAWGVP